MATFTQEDLEFLEGLNSSKLPEESRIGLTSKHGYVRNLDRDKLQHLENIYKRSIAPSFVLCFHCPNDVLQMVKGIYRELEKFNAAQPMESIEHEITAQDLEMNPELAGQVKIGETVTLEGFTLAEGVATEKPKRSRRKKTDSGEGGK